MISNKGGELMGTLAEKVVRNFSIIKIKSASVRVPKLKARKRAKTKPKQHDKIPISSIVGILMRNALEDAKKEAKKEKKNEENKHYIAVKDDRQDMPGGYGTISGHYGTSPQTSYVDYGKLFSYLGKFKSRSPYESLDDPFEFLNKATESGSFTLVDRETMDKGKFYARYVNSKTPIDKTSLVPIAGMTSAEWEQFKWFMRLDTAMYLLKISTS